MNVVITGSSTGIGHALTERLLASGHRVWGVARSDQSARAASAERFRSTRADVADWSQMLGLAEQVEHTWMELHALVTCAGIQGEIGPALACDPAAWSSTVRANLDGTYYALRALAPLLLRTPGRSKVICFSGGGATKSRPHFSAYGVAKTGVVRLVETIAEEMQGRPFDINSLAPGAINTRLTEEVLALGPEKVGAAEYDAARKQLVSGGGSLPRVLDCIEWLLSPAGDGISGRLISAPWDPWSSLDRRGEELAGSDIYMLRRVLPEDRGRKW